MKHDSKRNQTQTQTQIQFSEHSYLGSSIDERGSPLGEVKKRIGMSKTAFWKCKELLRRVVNMELKKRVLNCDVKSVLSYGCETWTFNKAIRRRVEALQMLCYRRIPKIKFTEHVTNEKLREIVAGKEEGNWAMDVERRKLRYAGQILVAVDEGYCSWFWRKGGREKRTRQTKKGVGG